MTNPTASVSVKISPTFAAVVFFALYAFFFFLFTKFTISSLAISGVIPLFTGIIGSMITGRFIGYLFGNLLVKEISWQKLLFIGGLIGVIAILLISINILLYLVIFNPQFFKPLHYWQDFFVVYGMMTLSTFLILAPWLLPITAAATVYFNKSFYPRLLLAESQGTSPTSKL